jgi:transcriptional regulator with XRE-family HTH domain
MGAVEAPTAAAGERLRALRKGRGYSQSELSRRTVTVGDLGVAEITIRSIESGKRTGSADTFAALARALGVGEDAFPEIRLARARALFDEREIGLEARPGELRAVHRRRDARRASDEAGDGSRGPAAGPGCVSRRSVSAPVASTSTSSGGAAGSSAISRHAAIASRADSRRRDGPRSRRR